MKVVGFGFRNTGKSAYLRNSWNVGDLIILIGSIIATITDLFSGSGHLNFMKVFRLGRALRPLRVLRTNQSMRIVVSSLMASIGDIFNVYLLTQVIDVMFAIMGVSLFSGLFYQCTNPAILTEAECFGEFTDPNTGFPAMAVWTNPSYRLYPGNFSNDPTYSFDDVASGFLLVKEIIVTEGWTEVLGQGMDITSPGLNHQYNNSRMNALFFMAIITVGTFFAQQLYTGVIVKSYSKSDGTAFMTPSQRMWVNAKLKILQEKPPSVGFNHDVWAPRRFIQDCVIPCRAVHAHKCVRRFHGLHSRVDNVIAVAVGLNMVVLAMYHYGMSDEFTFALDAANNVLLGVFGLDMLLKMFALGFRKYWKEPSNVFDGAIVIGSLVITVLSVSSLIQSSRFSYMSQVCGCVISCCMIDSVDCLAAGPPVPCGSVAAAAEELSSSPPTV